MSERQVSGFAVDPDLLWELVGSGLPAQEVLGDRYGAVEGLDRHLGHGRPGTTAAALARDVLAGRLDREQSGDVVRLLVPVLTAVGDPVYAGQPIWVQETMFLDWEATLDALGLSALAGRWGTPNFPWPWPRDGQPVAGWPVVTEWSPDVLAEVRAEFGRRTATGEPAWRATLADLPDDAFADDDGDVLDEPEDVREELDEALDRLAGWVERVGEGPASPRRCASPRGNSLVLVMDGDL